MASISFVLIALSLMIGFCSSTLLCPEGPYPHIIDDSYQDLNLPSNQYVICIRKNHPLIFTCSPGQIFNMATHGCVPLLTPHGSNRHQFPLHTKPYIPPDEESELQLPVIPDPDPSPNNKVEPQPCNKTPEKSNPSEGAPAVLPARCVIIPILKPELADETPIQRPYPIDDNPVPRPYPIDDGPIPRPYPVDDAPVHRPYPVVDVPILKPVPYPVDDTPMQRPYPIDIQWPYPPMHEDVSAYLPHQIPVRRFNPAHGQSRPVLDDDSHPPLHNRPILHESQTSIHTRPLPIRN